MSSAPVRVSQRAPQSCQRCSNKKMKCSKTVPCTACTKLGIADRCRREVVITPTQLRSANGGTGRKTHNRNRHRHHNYEVEQRQSISEVSNTDTNLSPDNAYAGSGYGFSICKDPAAGAAVDLIINVDSDRVYQGESNTYDNENLSTNFSPTSTRTPSYPGWPPVPQEDSVVTIPESRSKRPSDSAEDLLASDAATTLEFLAWGKQRTATRTSSGTAISGTLTTRTQFTVHNPGEILNRDQSKAVLEFHRENIVWMHNVLYFPTFIDECRTLWNHRYIQDKAWLSLYNAIFCLSLIHMSDDQCDLIGIFNREATARKLYQKARESIHNADFMSTHSIYSVQATCILVLCAHNFDGSNLIAVLLSCAIRISQVLNIHTLGPDPPTNSLTEQQRIDREVKKRIWAFLCIQDWFLIPFCKSHSITPSHCSTPLPANCKEQFVYVADGRIKEDDMEVPTQSSYIIVLYRVADVLRDLFDKTCHLPESSKDEAIVRSRYNNVLQADNDLQTVLKTIPTYLRRNTRPISKQVSLQRRAFTISVTHKTIMIHHSFFLKSLHDKWYTYTRITCIKAARIILEEYCDSFDGHNKDLWTVVAHVVSACIILLLHLILSSDHDFPNDDETNEGREIRKSIHKSQELLRKAENSSTISNRGIRLIGILLEQEQRGEGKLDVGWIADELQCGGREREERDGGSSLHQQMGYGLGYLDTFNGWEWGEFMASLGVEFDDSWCL